jgi:isopenicillin N synthase-like dioxygenase
MLTIIHNIISIKGGLQVDPAFNGKWIDVPVLERSFVVNVGRTLARWTNDRWLAAVHRVKSSPGAAPAAATKQTVAFFSGPDRATTVSCLPGCSDAGRPPRYTPFNFGDFMDARTRLHSNGVPDASIDADAWDDPRRTVSSAKTSE